MQTTTVQLLTIIAEHILEQRLLDDLKRLGARGYTISEVRGEGTRGIHASQWQGGNIKIETLVSAEVADRVLTHLAGDYFTDYAVVAYIAEVRVIRSTKFQ